MSKRPEVQIGERVFQPRQRGIINEAFINITLGVYDIALDCTQSFYQYERLLDRARLRFFYGKETQAAFDNWLAVIESRVRELSIDEEVEDTILGKENPYIWFNEVNRRIMIPLIPSSFEKPYSLLATMNRPLSIPPHPN